MSNAIRFGVIGGSGVYQLEGLSEIEEIALATPFGAPSDNYIVGTIHDQRVAFLPRHGRGHILSPTNLNYRANIYGFKMLGVEYLISVSACGSLRENLVPGHIVIPDQLFDRTTGRALSFFDSSAGASQLVAHINFAEPFCPQLAHICFDAVRETGAVVHKGGTFITIEGPRFSTRAESNAFRSWGMDIIGMTTTPEAQLAREAEMSYAVMAHVTDYDSWHETNESVTVEMVVETLHRSAETAKQAVSNAIRLLADQGASPQADALRNAIMTARERIPAASVQMLDAILGKYF